jgi:hypothetical protein
MFAEGVIAGWTMFDVYSQEAGLEGTSLRDTRGAKSLPMGWITKQKL